MVDDENRSLRYKPKFNTHRQHSLWRLRNNSCNLGSCRTASVIMTLTL